MHSMFGRNAYQVAMIQHLSFFCFYNTTFFYSGYVIKPPQPSSTIYGAPPFIGNHCFRICYMPEVRLDPEYRSQLWQDSAFFSRTQNQSWSQKFKKKRTRTWSHFWISAVAGVCVVIS